ncbi:hypothetical protein [Swingsia samuiensis]|uniref:Tetratricopeptide repeat protein n=1 Tax=Swingsia samuiensis TaxID=1293412 RepID=A0A4Y6UJF1_9PROT|nr:hypothetical protein [Swingsia samuiensis]QDH17692.1 hypothetical protein E3D00_09035 [Swingsia samuiensis]
MRYTVCGAFFLLLASCSSGNSGKQPDSQYEDAMETGRSVFDMGHPDQAEMQYRAAMKRALLRADPQQIHDAGFNLATSLVREKKPAQAIQEVDKTLATLSLYNYNNNLDFYLIKAAAAAQQKNWVMAEGFSLKALKSSDGSTHDQAAYLAGISADALGDRNLLAQMKEALSPAKGKTTISLDYQELSARLDVKDHHYSQALTQAMQLVQERRDALDYDGMRNALLIGAYAAEGMGNMQEAANLRQQENLSAQK